jgi:hypothetical protein
MKRFLTILCALALLAACGAVTVYAQEDPATYRDAVYSFRYPASWKQGTAKDGSIVLEIPGTGDGVISFAIFTDLIRFTGDEETDAPTIQNLLAEYSGKNLSFTGEYELVRYGALQGFRAPGRWAGKQDACMICAADGGHLVSFVLIGKRAIAEEAALLESVVTFDNGGTDTKEGFKTWRGKGYSLLYPENYSTLEQTTGVVFVDRDRSSQIIMARTYALNEDYSDALAPSIASQRLPKSTGLKAEPEMERFGGRNAAVIRGNADTGPIAFCVVGEGRTALALVFMGEEALSHAPDIIASVEFE